MSASKTPIPVERLSAEELDEDEARLAAIGARLDRLIDQLEKLEEGVSQRCRA